MTPNDLIKLALKMTGVIGQGQQPGAEDVNDAFTLLNMMMGQWNRRRWLIYHLIDVTVPMTGASSYAVGPGAVVNIARPDMIEAAYVRLLSGGNPVDLPLRVITSYEDYAAIPVKGLAGYPQSVFLDAGTPNGTLYVWPIPGAQYELHLIFKATLAAFGGLAQSVTLPVEYQEALLYNLAGRLRPAYQLPPEPSISALATASLNTIRNANAQVPLLKMPANLPTAGGRFNVYSGEGG